MFRIVMTLVGFVIGLIYSLWMSLLVPYYAQGVVKGVQLRGFWAHVEHFATPLTIESLRALGKIILGCLLLVVPGLIRIFTYYFVSYVVQFDPQYDAGNRDALATSRALWQKGSRLYPFLLIMILFALDIAWSYGTANVTYFSSPLAFVLVSLVDMALEIFSAASIYLLYLNLRGETSAPALHSGKATKA